jgi:hypothetical protein
MEIAMDHDNHTKLVYEGEVYQISNPTVGTVPYGYLRLNHADGYHIHITPSLLELRAKPYSE